MVSTQEAFIEHIAQQLRIHYRREQQNPSNAFKWCTTEDTLEFPSTEMGIVTITVNYHFSPRDPCVEICDVLCLSKREVDEGMETSLNLGLIDLCEVSGKGIVTKALKRFLRLVNDPNLSVRMFVINDSWMSKLLERGWMRKSCEDSMVVLRV